MITRVHKGGATFGGLARYLTWGDRHDAIELVNLAARDARTAARVMQATVAHASELKKLAGRSSRGRKLTKPAHHFSAAWHPDEDPTDEAMFGFGRRCLKALGFEDRQAVMVIHRDKKMDDGRVRHELHVMTNRVSFEDGTAASDRYDATRLAAVSQVYEQEQGQIYVQRSRDERLPSTKRQRKRLRIGGGRAVDMSPGERAAYSALKRRHAQERVPATRRKVERRELGRQLQRRRPATLAAAGTVPVLDVELPPAPARPRERATLRPTPAAVALEIELPPAPARPRERAVLRRPPAVAVPEVDVPPRPRPRMVERPAAPASQPEPEPPVASPSPPPAARPEPRDEQTGRRLSPEELWDQEERKLAAWEKEHADAEGPPASSTDSAAPAPTTASTDSAAPTDERPLPAPAPAGSLGPMETPVQGGAPGGSQRPTRQRDGRTAE